MIDSTENNQIITQYLESYEGVSSEDVKSVREINNTRDTYLIEFDNPDEIMVLEIKPYVYSEFLVYKQLDEFRNSLRDFLSPDFMEFINWDHLEEEKFSDLEVMGEFDGYVVVDVDDSSFLVKRLV